MGSEWLTKGSEGRRGSVSAAFLYVPCTNRRPVAGRPSPNVLRLVIGGSRSWTFEAIGGIGQLENRPAGLIAGCGVEQR